MPINSILLVLSLVCLLIASFTSFGRVNIGWVGMFFFVLSQVVR